jgi:hypothetical protein
LADRCWPPMYKGSAAHCSLSMDKTMKRPHKEEVEMEDVKMSDAVSLPPHSHADRAHDNSVNRVQREIEELKESIKKTEVQMRAKVFKVPFGILGGCFDLG